MFVRLSAMKAARFYSNDAMRHSYGDDVIRNVRRILLMMAERTNWIFECGCAMRVSGRANCGIAYGRKIKAEESVLSQMDVIKTCELHEEVVRMLTVRNRNSVGRFAFLKQQRIALAGDGRRLQAEHGSHG